MPVWLTHTSLSRRSWGWSYQLSYGINSVFQNRLKIVMNPSPWRDEGEVSSMIPLQKGQSGHVNTFTFKISALT